VICGLDLQNAYYIILNDDNIITVVDGVSGGQPACPGKWKMYRKKK
jgi:hypothetical protein